MRRRAEQSKPRGNGKPGPAAAPAKKSEKKIVDMLGEEALVAKQA